MSPHDVTQAIEAAGGYLGEVRRDGVWRGFPTRAGSSDQWVTGFVATHVAASSAAVDLAETTAALLERELPGGGWGYGGEVPADADSTAWCLSAVVDQAPQDVVDRAKAVLADHRVGAGYATYRADSGIAEFVGAAPSGAAGWTGAHPDVTAAVVLAGVPAPGDEDEEEVLRRLIGSATATGLVPSYWWRGMLYATALTLRALAARGRRAAPAWEQAAAEGLTRLQRAHGGYALGASPIGDPFTTALALEAWCRLPHLDHERRRDRAAEALLLTQSPDGRWLGDHVLRIPAPGVRDPRLVGVWARDTGGGNSFVRDVGGVFATAAAAHSLGLWRQDAAPPAGQVLEPSDAEPGVGEVVVARPGID